MDYVAQGKDAVIFRDRVSGDIYRIYRGSLVECAKPESFFHSLVSPLPFFLKLKSSSYRQLHGIYGLWRMFDDTWEHIGEDEDTGLPIFEPTEEREEGQPLYIPKIFPVLTEVAPFQGIQSIDGQAEVFVLPPENYYVDVLEACAFDLSSPVLTLEQRISLLCLTCVGLMEAQERYEFVHGDLHGQNVLIQPSAEQSYTYGDTVIPLKGYAPRIADFSWSSIYKPSPEISCMIRARTWDEWNETYAAAFKANFNLYPEKPFDAGYDIAYLLHSALINEPRGEEGRTYAVWLEELLRSLGVTWHPKTRRPLTTGTLTPQVALSYLRATIG